MLCWRKNSNFVENSHKFVRPLLEAIAFCGNEKAAVPFINVINVCNVYKKLINAFVNFVDVYYFNKRYMKCGQALSSS